VPIAERWAAGKSASKWLFNAAAKGDLFEAVGWVGEAIAAIGRPELRVHDLRHTAASVWLGSSADPKVVQRVLGHASVAMTILKLTEVVDSLGLPN
jgi:integrase